MIGTTLTSLALATTLASGAPATTNTPTPGTTTAASSTPAVGTAATMYTVKSGDTLWKISQATGVPIASIEQANSLSNPDALTIGERLTIPASASSVKTSTPTTVTPQPVVSTQPTVDHSVLSLQRRLADLGYLPLTDAFQWKYANIPPSLMSLWQPGANNVMTKGAVMAFQADNGLTTDGIAGPLTWAAIDKAVANNAQNVHGYSFVYVSDTSPFTLYLWNDGQYVLNSLANLGIPDSQTVTGTYPVYLQYQSQEMKGTNPNGTTYDDPGVPYVSYFYRGEAIHGFTRQSYGSQQSLGCVELPYASAQSAWSYVHIGTLVNIDK